MSLAQNKQSVNVVVAGVNSGQLSHSEGDSEGDVVKLVHLLMMWRDRLSVKGTKPAIPNTLKKDVLAGGHVSCLLFNSEVFKPFMLGIYMPQGL